MLFYHAVDEVIVPSRSTAKLLHKRGLRKRKLLLLDRWVDVERFHPAQPHRRLLEEVRHRERGSVS